jgi:hypothetical protein
MNSLAPPKKEVDPLTHFLDHFKALEYGRKTRAFRCLNEAAKKRGFN